MADELRPSLPAALIEKMAEAMDIAPDAGDVTPREMWRRFAEAAAAALLDECEVRVEYGAIHDACEHWGYRNLPTWASDRGWSPVQRVVMAYTGPTEPAPPVAPPLVAPFVRLEGPPGEEPG